MGAGKAVNANVVVFDEATGKATFVAAGQVPPDSIRSKLGDHLFVGSGNDEDQDAGPPPQSGRGSGRDRWVDYAGEHIEITEDMQRDDIIAALREAGVDVGDDEE